MSSEDQRTIKLVLKGKETINFWEGYAKMYNSPSLESFLADWMNREVALSLEVDASSFAESIKNEGKYKIEAAE